MAGSKAKAKSIGNLALDPSDRMRRKLIEFADLYRGGPDEIRGNQTACYMKMHPRSSYKTAEVRAYEYMAHPVVKEHLDQKAGEVAEQADITAEYVLKTIKDTIERCSQAKPVYGRDGKQVMVETEDGELAPAYTFDSSAVLKGCELLGKNLKLWTDKVEASVNGGQSLGDLLKQARDESE